MWQISFERIILFYLLLINVVGFTTIAVDKYRSVNKKWRIRERNFFIISIFGGGIGVYSGMYFYKHKTKHRYFAWGIPAILVLQLICVYYIIFNW